MQNHTTCLLCTLGATIALAGSTNAAPISWNAAQNTTASAANDIIDGGTVVLALNGHNLAAAPSSNVTLDGVTFVWQNTLTREFNSGGTQLDGNTTNDAAYDELLSYATVQDGDGADDVTYTIAGLTDGTDYLIQVWYTEERDAQAGRVMSFGDNEVTGTPVSVAGEGSNGFGQFATGSFTASGTSQELQLVATNFGRSQFTAVLVREVPEPSSIALLGLGGLCVMRRRRK